MTIQTQVFSAIFWLAIARLSVQIISWAVALYVIRILSPQDYGLIAMAGIVIGMAAVVNQLGFIPALIQTKKVTDDLIRQISAVAWASNLFLFLILVIIAPYVAALFGEEDLAAIIRTLAITLPVLALSAAPAAMLRREIRFKGLSIVEFFTTLVSSLVTLYLAIKGFGVWSLVVGQITGTVVKSIGVLSISRQGFVPKFQFSGLGGFFQFGAKVTLQNVIWYADTKIDLLVVGKLLGSHSLGVYSVAFNLAILPMSKAMAILNQVAFPAYARMQKDTVQASGSYLKSVELTSFVFMPLMFGFSSIAPDFLSVILGEKWIDATIVLQLVTLAVPFMILTNLLIPLVNGLDRPDIGVRNVLTSLALKLPAILIGCFWGLQGVCIAIVLSVLMTWIVNLQRSLAALNCSLRQVMKKIIPGGLSATVMYVAVYTTNVTLLADVTSIWRLSASIAIGVFVYSALTFVFNRQIALWSADLILRRKYKSIRKNI